LYLQSEKGLGRHAIVGEFAEVLGETAAHIEKTVAVRFEKGDDARVTRLPAETEVNKAELANTGPGEHVPDLVALDEDISIPGGFSVLQRVQKK
jgi:hypothetical protein